MKINNIIHIGRHKTGSTALQNFLSFNRRQLASLGIGFPVPLSLHADLAVQFMYEQGTPLPNDIAHRFPWLALAPDSPIRKVKECIRNLQLRQTLLSCEGFCNVYPSVIAKHFPPAETQIMAYIRGQLEYLLSAYAQAIQETKRTYSFLEFEHEIYLDYVPFIEQWKEVFRTNVTVRLYSRETLIGGDIRKDFLCTLGNIDPDSFIFDSKGANPSIGGPLLQFKLLLNRVSPWPVERLMPATYRELGALAESEPRFRQKLALPQVDYERIRNKYQRPNKVLARMLSFGGDDLLSLNYGQSNVDLEQQKLSRDDFETIMEWFKERVPEFYDEHYALLLKELPS